jgi:hypothetical protein
MRRFSAALAVCAATACVPSIDYTGKRCFANDPCPNGWVCGTDDRCARAGVDSGVESTDGGDMTVDSGYPHYDPARCTDPEHYPMNTWEARHFTLPSDMTFHPENCLGVEDVPGEFINRDYGLNGIADSILLFMSQWTGTRTFPRGSYNFSATHDDGIRIFMNGKKIYDHWGGPHMTASATITGYLSTGDYMIGVDYNNNAGAAYLIIEWDTICRSLDPTTTSWAIAYYRTDASGKIDATDCLGGETKSNQTYALTWGANGPPLTARSGTKSEFAIVGRTRRVLPAHTVFTLAHTDQMRFFVGTSTVYEQLGPRARTSSTVSWDLDGVQDLRFEMVDLSGAGSVSLSW